ncbi:hypothetical protein PROPEN_02350 [Proteus penneri ATCC 35198]|nr:hypothetical protein PROPEN_02350 [Proteus penneri ATCC 35198]
MKILFDSVTPHHMEVKLYHQVLLLLLMGKVPLFFMILFHVLYTEIIKLLKVAHIIMRMVKELYLMVVRHNVVLLFTQLLMIWKYK